MKTTQLQAMFCNCDNNRKTEWDTIAKAFTLDAIKEESKEYEALSNLIHELKNQTSENFAYELVVNALDFIDENEQTDDDMLYEFADSQIMIYSADLLNWLASSLNNIATVEEQEGSGLIDKLQFAQYALAIEAYNGVLEILES